MWSCALRESTGTRKLRTSTIETCDGIFDLRAECGRKVSINDAGEFLVNCGCSETRGYKVIIKA